MDTGIIVLVTVICLVVVFIIVYAAALSYVLWCKPQRDARRQLAQQREMEAARERGDLELYQRQLDRQQRQEQLRQQQQQAIASWPL